MKRDEVLRYDIWGNREGDTEMEVRDDGEWVRYEDYTTLREQLAVTDAQIEAAARGIYLHKYGAMGGRWECVETKDVRHDLARAALTAAREVHP
jgi:hypothetical protein